MKKTTFTLFALAVIFSISSCTTGFLGLKQTGNPYYVSAKSKKKGHSQVYAFHPKQESPALLSSPGATLQGLDHPGTDASAPMPMGNSQTIAPSSHQTPSCAATAGRPQQQSVPQTQPFNTLKSLSSITSPKSKISVLFKSGGGGDGGLRRAIILIVIGVLLQIFWAIPVIGWIIGLVGDIFIVVGVIMLIMWLITV